MTMRQVDLSLKAINKRKMSELRIRAKLAQMEIDESAFKTEEEMKPLTAQQKKKLEHGFKQGLNRLKQKREFLENGNKSRTHS